MKDNDMYYAYEMVFDKIEVLETNIECVQFERAFAKEYMIFYNEAFYPMRRALDIEPYNWYSKERDVYDKASEIYMFVINDELIGSVSCRENEIDDLFVKVSEHGKGYGKELLLWGMNHIRESNNEPIILHVAAWNKEALKLYQSIGFVVKNKERIK
ncbi:N-acetyltransferase [uncultured Eubacterium sp.]|uniref:GNAT family N-acetyltransferase n=1 Tax=uncultured Eubacterium sp. TaxID=165185 RepID=UPI0025990D8A|nr:GNAT family N-acetyltransferase [uncultured Eubacterium sp.]